MRAISNSPFVISVTKIFMENFLQMTSWGTCSMLNSWCLISQEWRESLLRCQTCEPCLAWLAWEDSKQVRLCWKYHISFPTWLLSLIRSSSFSLQLVISMSGTLSLSSLSLPASTFWISDDLRPSFFRALEILGLSQFEVVLLSWTVCPVWERWFNLN